MKNIAIIPARSGSKGLKDKNIIDLNGKPLMYYTIKAALESKCFDEVMVSTDSDQYAEIARKCGASVPFLRSEEMSGDLADSWDTVREVLIKYRMSDKKFDFVALLQPTSPLRDADDIKSAFELMIESNVDSAVSVTEVEHPIQWCFELPTNCILSELGNTKYLHMRRQELPTYYHENGAIYIASANKIMDSLYDLYSERLVGYIMPREKSIDIDSRLDLTIANDVMNMHL